MEPRLLLISNSTQHGSGYLDHCEAEIREHLGDVRRVLFVPYAVHDLDAYSAAARERYERMGYGLDAVHDADPAAAVERAEAIFIGGGNTFRLLDRLYREDLLEPLRRRVAGGAPYVGTSAGSNVACATIMTTNDMPIVQPPSFEALGLVPFQLNPHYLDPDPASTHKGETRDQRIAEFHEMNRADVLAIREGGLVRVAGGEVELRGIAGARLFRQGREPVDHAPGARLDFLLRQG